MPLRRMGALILLWQKSKHFNRKGRKGAAKHAKKILPYWVEAQRDVHDLVLVFGSFVDGDFPLVRREGSGNGVQELLRDSSES